MADGTTYTVEIDVPTGGTENATAAIAKLSAQLDASSAAAKGAADAVRAGEASYKLAETAATKAAQAVEKIGLAAQAQQGKLAKAMEVGDSAGVARAANALAALSAKQAEAQAKAASAAAAMNAEASSLDRLRGAAAAAANSQQAVSKSLEDTKKKAESLQKAANAAQGTGKTNEIAEGLGKLGGPLGSLGQKAFGAAEGMKKLGSSLGSAGPYAAIAVLLVAIAAGAAAVAVAAGTATLAILKFAVSNADAARSAELLKEQAKGGAAGLAATAKLALSLDSQAKKLKDSLGKIFSVGSKPLERFLEGIAKLVELFDENSVTANAMKVVFQSLFDPLLDGITDLIPKFVSMFIQFEILVLKAMIAIKPWGSTILEVGKWVGILALVVGGVLLVAVVALAAGVAAMAVGFAVLIGLVVAVIAGVVWFMSVCWDAGAAMIGGIGKAIDWLKGLSLTEIGGQLVDGLVNGITNAGPKVLTAITGLANGAITAAKKALGIASPSKVFAEIGMHTAAGMTEGVDDHAGAVQGSLEAMVDPSTAASSAGQGAAPTSAKASPSGGGAGVYNITINGASGDDDFIAKLRAALDMMATQAGGAHA